MEADDIMGSRAGLGTGYSARLADEVSSDLSSDPATSSRTPPLVFVTMTTSPFACSRAAFSCRTAPRIVNTVNGVPVGHVARVVVVASFNPVSAETGISGGDVGIHVVHVTAHPRLRMNEYLSTLSYYGYDVPEVDYNDWKAQLETFISAGFVQKEKE
ncbi:non-ribosomal peptide synthetase, partial [Metarhizium majus ARSEF 297]